VSKQRQSSRVPRFFNRIAAQGWHKSDFFTYTWKYPAFRSWLLSRVLPQERLVLSVGCGSGEIERDLAISQRMVVGLDVSLEMLRTGVRRGRLRNAVQADALHLPFRSKRFDLVMFMESVGYFELDGVLGEAKRVLTKGGRMIITAYPTHHNSDRLYKKLSMRDIIRELCQIGLEVVDQQMLTIGRSGVTSIAAEERCTILYAVAQRRS